jgi:four helix bundle protein
MAKPNLIVDKSFEFAVLIIKHLGSIKKANQADIFSRQLLKSATSIGANIREAHNAESKNDFIHKMGIAQKECDETRYWLELLNSVEYLGTEEFNILHNRATELLKIIRSIILTTKRNQESTRK